MKDELFRKVEAGGRGGGALLRVERPPSRAFVIEIPDVPGSRDWLDLSQWDLDAMLPKNVKTLRNREQGRRQTEGSARVLLQMAAKHLEAVRDVVCPSVRRESSRMDRIGRRDSRREADRVPMH